MSNETTTTTLNDLTNSALVQPTVIMALSEKPGQYRLCREFNLVDQGTNAATIPQQHAFWGSANDRGAGVDTELDGTEATALANFGSGFATDPVTLTCHEYGIATALTDNVAEDSVRGIDILDGLIKGPMLHAMTLAWDDDLIALFTGLSNSVGSTGVDLTIVQMISAQQGLRTRGTDADAVYYLLDNQQASDIEAALITTNAAAAVFALSADRLINYAPTADNGMKSSRQIMTFRGAPVVASGLTDTANTGADVVGACFCPSTAYNDVSGATTYGMGWKRIPRFEAQRQAKLRGTDLVMTSRVGFAELQDGSGTNITSDAP